MKDLIEGIQKDPIVTIVYGVPGVGKSTLITETPNILFVGPERIGNLNTSKLKKTTSHDQLMQQLRDIENGIYDRKGFRNLSLDSIDMHEKIIHQEIIKREPGKSLVTAMGGFGKAVSYSGTKLVEVRDQLEAIRNKKEMNIFVIGHSILTKVSDPLQGIEYDSYEMCLQKTKRNDYNSIFTDWADMILFMNWKSYLTEEGNRAVSYGKREILTEFRTSHLAKNRFNLPYSIELKEQGSNWSVIQQHIDNFYNSGSNPNNFINEFNIIFDKCSKKISEIRNEDMKSMAIESLKLESSKATTQPNEAYNSLLNIFNQANNIVSNQ